MTRKARELVNGGIYHVFNRGNDKMDLFRDPMDFRCFRNRLWKIKQALGFQIFHYCLMTNHFHFLLRVLKGSDLPSLMLRLQLSYALYFKKKYEFVGHVYQERFRSPRIAEDSYYLQCGRYIEQNPIQAGLVKEPWTYGYSSAAFYVKGQPDDLVTPNIFYEEMGRSPEERKKNYKNYLMLDDPYAEMIQTALLKS